MEFSKDNKTAQIVLENPSESAEGIEKNDEFEIQIIKEIINPRSTVNININHTQTPQRVDGVPNEALQSFHGYREGKKRLNPSKSVPPKKVRFELDLAEQSSSYQELPRQGDDLKIGKLFKSRSAAEENHLIIISDDSDEDDPTLNNSLEEVPTRYDSSVDEVELLLDELAIMTADEMAMDSDEENLLE